MKAPRLPYVQIQRVRGREYHYFHRDDGAFRRRLPGAPGAPEYLAAYATAQLEFDGIVEARKITPELTVARAMTRWERDTWGDLTPQTKRDYRSTLAPWLDEYGDIPVAEIERTNIRGHLNRRAGTPSQANKCRKRLKAFFAYALAERMIAHDPTLGVKRLKVSGDGYHSWTEPEIAQYEAHWPIGSRQRLAFAIALYTDQRRGDVAAWTWTDVTPPASRATCKWNGGVLT